MEKHWLVPPWRLVPEITKKTISTDEIVAHVTGPTEATRFCDADCHPRHPTIFQWPGASGSPFQTAPADPPCMHLPKESSFHGHWAGHGAKDVSRMARALHGAKRTSKTKTSYLFGDGYSLPSDRIRYDKSVRETHLAQGLSCR